MSGMIRAFKNGDASFNNRRVRSLSGGSSNGSSSASEEGGARLSQASNSPAQNRVRFSSITQEFGRFTLSCTASSGGSVKETTESSSPFQVGKPSDVFMGSPTKPARKVDADEAHDPFIKAQAALVMMGASRDHHLVKAVATDNGNTAVSSGMDGNGPIRNTPSRNTPNRSASRHQIGGVDVQGIYPPSACVFVANLPESKDDRTLEVGIVREFSKYGTVFVKIRRDANRMPFAFCQYTKDEDAQLAMREGKGALICGRPCRTEMVKANRTFLVYSRKGNSITTEEARAIMEPYGELSECKMLSAQIQEALKLPGCAILVEFANFDPKRDLNMAVRENDEYCIDAFDLKKKNIVSRADADEEFLRKYDVDRRSIFIGRLPFDVDKEEIIELFSAVGEILNVDLIKRKQDGIISTVFAFVEFARADTPDIAIAKFNGKMMRGFPINVERKVFKHAGTPRRVKSQAFTKVSVTPKTPKSATLPKSPLAEISDNTNFNTPLPASQTRAFEEPVVATTTPLVYHAASPIALGADGKSLIGLGGIPASTPAMAVPLNPYSFVGGYWPNITTFQDPITGVTYYTQTPSVVQQEAATPQQVPDTPTRSREHRERRYA